MPNFFIVGAQKAGTTSLCRYLQEHPQIYMSSISEPGFFAFEGEKINFCGPGDERILNRVVTDLEKYRQLFADVTHETAIGEGTTLYLQSSKAANRIAHYVPNAKIIVILRNPVDRAYSAFMHLKRDNLEQIKIEDFSKALLEEEKRINNNWGFLWRYKTMGLYSQALQRYYDYFPSDRIKVYLYEDFNNQPHEILKDIYRFLNVDEQYLPDFLPRYNVSGIPKSRILYNFMKNESKLRSALKPLIPNKLQKKVVNYIKLNNLVKSKLSPKTKSEIIEIFRDDIVLLQNIIDKDLSSWLTY